MFAHRRCKMKNKVLKKQQQPSIAVATAALRAAFQRRALIWGKCSECGRFRSWYVFLSPFESCRKVYMWKSLVAISAGKNLIIGPLFWSCWQYAVARRQSEKRMTHLLPLTFLKWRRYMVLLQNRAMGFVRDDRCPLLRQYDRGSQRILNVHKQDWVIIIRNQEKNHSTCTVPVVRNIVGGWSRLKDNTWSKCVCDWYRIVSTQYQELQTNLANSNFAFTDVHLKEDASKRQSYWKLMHHPSSLWCRNLAFGSKAWAIVTAKVITRHVAKVFSKKVMEHCVRNQSGIDCDFYWEW